MIVRHSPMHRCTKRPGGSYSEFGLCAEILLELSAEFSGKCIQIEHITVLCCIESASGESFGKIFSVVAEDIIRFCANRKFLP